ncbi:hypothetical protein HY374_01040 [Candidatus Berkelbacteria bacterium]|nr:hypothetical protein [Candidatus Berkelbacteria bacterium]
MREQSRWFWPWVSGMILAGATAYCWALGELHRLGTLLDPTTATLLLVTCLFISIVEVKLPDGTPAYADPVCLVPVALLTMGYEGIVIAGSAQLAAATSRRLRIAYRAWRVGKLKKLWRLHVINTSCALHDVATTALMLLVTSVAVPSATTELSRLIWLLVLILAKDGLSFHAMALVGWQPSEMRHGPTLARWRAQLPAWWDLLPVYPIFTLIGYLATEAIATGNGSIWIATLIEGRVFQVLLLHRSFLLLRLFRVILAMVVVMEGRDPYTAGHTLRVTIVTIKLLLRAGFAFMAAIMAAIVGAIHDLGKLATDDEILNKKGAHTPWERRRMQGHVWDNLTLEKRWAWLFVWLPFLVPILGLLVPSLFVYWFWWCRRLHHLRIDGMGYPEGVQRAYVAVAQTYFTLTAWLIVPILWVRHRGNRVQIEANLASYRYWLRRTVLPLVARIMPIADTYDAMTSDRPYRKGMPQQLALSEKKMRRTTVDPERPDDGITYGGQLDPVAVDTLVELCEEGRVKPNDTNRQLIREMRRRLPAPNWVDIATYIVAIPSTTALIQWAGRLSLSTAVATSLLLVLIIAALRQLLEVPKQGERLFEHTSLEALRRAGYDVDMVGLVWSTRTITTVAGLTMTGPVALPAIVDAIGTKLELDERLYSLGMAPTTLCVARAFTNRVVHLAGWLAARHSLGWTTRRRLRRAARLMHIGRIGISNLEWQRTDQLTPEERRRFKGSARTSARLIRFLSDDKDLAALVLLAGGLPSRTLHMQTRLAAVMLSLAETYTALCFPRPYRAAFSREDALALLVTEAKYHPSLLGLLREYVAANR